MPDGRVVATSTAPISIDAAEYSRLASELDTDEEIEALTEQFSGRTVLLGVDRLDYTKGIVERLLAVEMLLERNPELRARLVFLQIAVPSRDNVREYRQLRTSVEQLTGRINGVFTEPGGDVPVHYLYRSLSPEQLTAYYALADALLVTPLIDGMNLVCKEYVTVQHAREGSGALVLSEFTGAAVELYQAILCNPFDVEGLSFRIEQALRMTEQERRSALAAMADHVRHPRRPSLGVRPAHRDRDPRPGQELTSAFGPRPKTAENKQEHAATSPESWWPRARRNQAAQPDYPLTVDSGQSG